jgi:hypothetical protein
MNRTFATPAARAFDGTLYRFRLSANWKGRIAQADIIAVDKDDADAFARANTKTLVGMPKTSIDRLGWIETIEPDRAAAPLGAVAEYLVDVASGRR